MVRLITIANMIVYRTYQRMYRYKLFDINTFSQLKIASLQSMCCRGERCYIYVLNMTNNNINKGMITQVVYPALGVDQDRDVTSVV